jgi:S-formylglutathione hydrolase FrmB
VAEDVTSYVVQAFGTSADPSQWAVVGLSEGGTCSLVLSLRHTDRFRVAVDFSGDLGPNLGPMAPVGRTLSQLFGGSVAEWEAHDPRTLLTHRRYPELSLWFEAGQTDARRVAYAQTLSTMATEAGADAHLGHRSGGHRFTFWERALPDAFPWLMQKLGLPA